MFEKLKWKLRGKLKVKKNKLKNEATYVLEFAPEDYKEVIKHFPLINNALLENFSNEDDFLRIESGQYGVDILNFKIVIYIHLWQRIYQDVTHRLPIFAPLLPRRQPNGR